MTTEQNEEKKTPSLSELDEDNHMVRKVIKTLEDWGWHPRTQKDIQLYIRVTDKNEKLLQSGKPESWFIKHSEVKTTAPYFFHNTLSKDLFVYQSAVNLAISNNNYDFSIRKKLIIFLGCKCVCCGTEDIELLQLDHKKTLGGRSDRRWAKQRKLNLFGYYWNNLIDAWLNLQVLCIKCHRLKTRGKLTQNDIEQIPIMELKETEKTEVNPEVSK